MNPGTRPMFVVTAAEMRAMDAETIGGVGVPGLVLMEHAGTLTARALAARMGGTEGRRVPRRVPRRVVVLCGKGNNGGDGFVVARLLMQAGAEVTAFLAGAPAEVKGDARVNLEAFAALGGTVHPAADVTPRRLKAALEGADWVVDALFGTGLNSPLRDPARAWARAANRAGRPVAAVDIASGIHADTGEVMGDAVRAALTVTFACPKRGHLLEPGAEHTGDLVVADIGIPEAVIRAHAGPLNLVTPAEAAARLPGRRRAAHKGSFGHVLVAGGSVGMTGAATLASLGALHAGAGLVTAAVPAGLNDILEQKLTEAMTLPMPETPGRTLGEKALEPLLSAAAARSVTVLGPGLSRDAQSRRLARAFTEAYSGPLVIDADGLNAWAGHMDDFPRRAAPTVLTPHPGEMARLAGRTASEVRTDRIDLAVAFAREHEVTLVLKGAHTVVADPFGPATVNPTGGPALASGGTGDVLAGMIGAYLAQGLSAADAAVLAVYLHGLAADLWVERHGPAGLGAGDLAALIPDAAARLARGDAPAAVGTIGPLD
jgi:hydroxyethylthiazole kinase-like uncharacterized protein yjeF